MATRKKEELDFESTIQQLETIVARLENGDLPLEEALTEFEKGVKLAAHGQARLQQAEQRVQILLEKSAQAPLTDYQNNKTTSSTAQEEDDEDIPF